MAARSLILMSAPAPRPSGVAPTPLTRPDAPPARRAPRLPLGPSILGIGLVIGLLAYVADTRQGANCGTPGGCLSQAFEGLLFTVLIPVFTLVALLIVRFPRRDRLLVVPLCGLGLLWAYASGWLQQWRAGFVFDTHYPAMPVWLWMLALTACLVASWLAVRRAPTPLLVRVLSPALVIAVSLGIVAAAGHAKRTLTAEQLRAVPVTPYLPEISGATLATVSASSDRVYLTYDEADGRTIDVRLVPANGRSTCEAARDGYYGSDLSGCSGDEFVASEPSGEVALLRRGDTVLLASARLYGPKSATLLAALRSAPETDAAALAFAAKSP